MRMYKPNEFAKMIGVSIKTLQRWDNIGQFKAFRNPANRRYYTYDQYEEYIHGVGSVSEVRRLSSELENYQNVINPIRQEIQSMDMGTDNEIYQNEALSPNILSLLLKNGTEEPVQAIRSMQISEIIKQYSFKLSKLNSKKGDKDITNIVSFLDAAAILISKNTKWVMGEQISDKDIEDLLIMSIQEIETADKDITE